MAAARSRRNEEPAGPDVSSDARAPRGVGAPARADHGSRAGHGANRPVDLLAREGTGSREGWNAGAVISTGVDIGVREGRVGGTHPARLPEDGGPQPRTSRCTAFDGDG